LERKKGKEIDYVGVGWNYGSIYGKNVEVGA